MTIDNYIQIFGYLTLASVTLWSAIYSKKKSRENLLSNNKKEVAKTKKVLRKFFPDVLLALSILFLIYCIYILSHMVNWISITFICLAVLLTSVITLFTFITPIVSIFEHQNRVISQLMKLIEKDTKSQEVIKNDLEIDKNKENNAP